jgi:hypothetical protein
MLLLLLLLLLICQHSCHWRCLPCVLAELRRGW